MGSRDGKGLACRIWGRVWTKGETRSSRAWGLCAKPAVLLGGPATRDLGPPALGGRYSQEEVAAGTGRGPGWMGEDGQLGAGG